MKPNDLYFWQIETADGKIISQFDQDGQEHSWKEVENKDAIIRVSLIPKLAVLPQHDIIIDIASGEKFIKRFGRGFIKQGNDGFKLREYVNCIITNRYRAWIFSTGRVLITRKDYEVYL